MTMQKLESRYPSEFITRKLAEVEDDIYFNVNLREFSAMVPDRAYQTLEEAIADVERTQAFEAAQKATLAKYYTPAKDSLACGLCSQCGEEFPYFTKIPTDAGCVDLAGPWELCDDCFKIEERRKRQERDRIEREAQEALKEKEAHDRHMRAFWVNNPEAQHYCHETGNPPCPEQYAEVQAFDPSEREDGKLWSGMVLIGPSFKGKTTSAYHYLKTMAEDGEVCLAITSFDLNGIPEAVRAGRDAFQELTEPWYDADVLLIDDCDKANVTPRVASELWNLFEKRLRSGSLITIVTLNTCTKVGFLKLFARKGEDSTSHGISILNRLKHHCKFIQFKGVNNL